MLITEYPIGLFDKENGEPEGDCGLFELDPGEAILEEIPVLGDALVDLRRRLNANLPIGVSPRQAEIIKTLGGELNDEVRKAADEHGWTLIGGIADRFDGHGYCSGDRYWVTLQESLFGQLDHLGMMHPNATGQVEMSVPIADALEKALSQRSSTRRDGERDRTRIPARRGGSASRDRDRDDARRTPRRRKGARVRDHRRK